MGDLVWVRVFFPQTFGDRILFPDIQLILWCNIFSSMIRRVGSNSNFFRQVHRDSNPVN